jgi:Glycosyl transferase family 2
MTAVDGHPVPPLSVVVPTTHNGYKSARCLAAINAARVDHDELIVVDDVGLTGPASARNRGAVKASNPILVFVDADVEIQPNALTLIRERFAADPGLAAVFGSYDDDPQERDVVSTFRNLLHHHVHQGAAGNVHSFWSGLGAVRRAAFEEVGGFDPCITRASVEDIELGARLSASGQIRLDPMIQGKHLKRWTFSGMVRTDMAQRGIPWTRLALRGKATRSELNLEWPHRLSAASSVVLALSLTGRRPAHAAVSFGVLCVINRRFYGLLARRGRRHLLGGIGLHVIHHLTSVLALFIGIAGTADPRPTERARNPHGHQK